MCKDFTSDTWPVPDSVTASFFPEPVRAAPPTVVARMPSRARKISLEALGERSRPALPKPHRPRKKLKEGGGQGAP